MAWRHRLANTGEGAVSGASTGAGIGSFFGPKGTAIGAGIGTGIGAILGFLSDTEQQELAESWARGELDPEVADYLTELVSERFGEIRMEQNARLDRSGIGKSSIAERIRGETDTNERDTLAKAFMDQIFARQQLGLGMQAQRRAQTGQTVGGAVDNLMSILSGFKAEERWQQDRMDSQSNRNMLMRLASGQTYGPQAAPKKLTPNEAKAAVTVGMMPSGSGRGASGSSWGHLSHGQKPQSKMGVLQSRQGGGSYDSRSANPWFSGSRDRKPVY